MSKEIIRLKDSVGDRMVYFTSFYGGTERGKCLQITINDEYVSLRKKDVEPLIVKLVAWLTEK